MLRNMQNLGSVFQLRAGDFAGMLTAADPVHGVRSAEHLCSGKRPSRLGASGKQSPGLLECASGSGLRRSRSLRYCREQLSRRDVVGVKPTRPRTAGDPPAAIWAALVIQRAMTN